jgi:hypothetical protein
MSHMSHNIKCPINTDNHVTCIHGISVKDGTLETLETDGTGETAPEIDRQINPSAPASPPETLVHFVEKVMEPESEPVKTSDLSYVCSVCSDLIGPANGASMMETDSLKFCMSCRQIRPMLMAALSAHPSDLSASELVEDLSGTDRLNPRFKGLLSALAVSLGVVDDNGVCKMVGEDAKWMILFILLFHFCSSRLPTPF